MKHKVVPIEFSQLWLTTHIRTSLTTFVWWWSLKLWWEWFRQFFIVFKNSLAFNSPDSVLNNFMLHGIQTPYSLWGFKGCAGVSKVSYFKELGGVVLKRQSFVPKIPSGLKGQIVFPACFHFTRGYVDKCWWPKGFCNLEWRNI